MEHASEAYQDLCLGLEISQVKQVNELLQLILRARTGGNNARDQDQERARAQGQERASAAPGSPQGPTIGGKIQELIDARGLSVYAAADMLGMSRQQLWRIIKGSYVKGGVKDPGLISVQKIVRGLGGRMKDICADGDLYPTATARRRVRNR